MSKFDFEAMDNDNQSAVKPATPFFLEGSYTENGVTTNTKKIFLSNYFPSAQPDHFRYINKYMASVERLSGGTKQVNYFYCNKVDSEEYTEEDFLKLIQDKLSNIDTFFYIPDVFSIKFSELKQFSSDFKKLCEKLDINKKEFEKNNKIISIIPALDFKQLAIDFNSFVVVLEDYLLKSFKYKIMQNFVVDTGELSLKHYFYPFIEISNQDAQVLLDSCMLNFCLLENAIFYKKDFSQIVTNQVEYNDLEDIFSGWVDIKSVEFLGDDVEKFLISGKTASIKIFRPFLYGNYEPIREQLTKTFIRNLFINFKVIKSFYFEEDIPVDWQDFCSVFLRPALTLTYDPKSKGDKKSSVLNSPLKTLKQKTDEDKKIAKERREKAEANAKRKEEQDTGILSDLIKEIKNSVDKDSLYKVLQRVVLKNLVEASKDCVGEFVALPSIKIPNIELPSFDFSFKINVNDVSGDMYKKIIDQMIKVSFENTVKTVERFFTVKDCEDLQQIFSKDKYKDFYKSLKSAISDDFEAIVENLKQTLKDLAEQLQKDFCNTELYLVTLYNADKILSPADILELTSGTLDTKKSLKFLDFMNINNQLYFEGELCGSLEPSELNLLYINVGNVLDSWRDNAEELMEDKEPEVTYQSSLKCETAFGSFVDWMRENGFSKDVINCVVEKSTEEKSNFLLDLYEYVNRGGVSEVEQVQVDDASLSDTAKILFDANFSFWFDNWEQIVKNYKDFAKSKTQPESVNINQKIQDIFNGFGISGVDIVKSEVSRSLTTSGVLSEWDGTTDYDIGKIGTGPAFFDTSKYMKNNPDKFVFNFDKEGKSFTFQQELIDGHVETVQFSRSNNDFFFPQQHIYINDDLNFPVYQEVVAWNKDQTKNIIGFDSYSKLFGSYCIKNVPEIFTNRIGLFERFVGGDLYNYTQQKFVNFLKKQVLETNELVLDTFDVIKENGKPLNVDEFEVFCSTVSKIGETQDVDGFCTLFGREQWEKLFKNILSDVYKERGNYDKEVALNKFGLKLKTRLFSLFFRMATPNFLRFFNENGNYCINGYFKSLFGEEFSNFFDGDYQFDDYSQEAEVNLAKNHERFQIERFLEAPEALEGMFPNFLNDGYVFPELELNKNITENIDIVSRCFSSMFNGRAVGIFEKYLHYLQFRHFNDYINYDVSGVSINSHYNNIGLIKDRCDLFLEVVYMERGIRKTFGISGGTRDFSPIKPQFVNYAQVRPYDIVDLLKTSTLNKIEKININLSFAQFNFPTLNHQFHQGINDIGYILPIVSLEIAKQEIIDFVKKYVGLVDTQQQKIEMQNDFFDMCREKIINSSEFKNQYIHTLALDKIFECYNLLLFDSNMYSTNVGQLFNFKVKNPEKEQEELQQYKDNSSKFKNDTFGLLRSKYSVSDVQKLALKMAMDTPKLIFKAQVEATDPNIMLARRIVDVARLAGKDLDIRFVSLAMLQPINVWVPVGVGPPITPQGLMYLFLDFPDSDDKKGTVIEEVGTFENSILELYKNALSNSYVPCVVDDTKELQQLKPESCLVKNNLS